MASLEFCHLVCREAVILCGDFNALATSDVLKEIGRRLKNTHLRIESRTALKTLPSFYPMGLVDHIFTGSSFEWIDTKVPGTSLEKMSSDHLPLVVDTVFAR